MKKTLIAVAALVATGAFAQATVYGRVDVGYSTSATSTTGAVADVKDNGINNNNLATSYLGFTGSEDLGGGMKANITFEGNIAGDTGATALSFTRMSKVGLSGGFGSVDLGLDYTPFFKVASAADVMGQAAMTTMQSTNMPALATTAGFTAPAGNAIGNTVRQSDAIHYTSPNFNGMQVKVMYGPNLTATNNAAGTVNTEDKSTATGASFTYANGPLYVGVGMNSVENTSTVGTAASVVGKTESTAVSATYDLGKAKLYGNINSNKYTYGATGELKFAETNLGVSVPLGAVTLLAAVGNNKLTDQGTTDMTGTDMMIGATYDLSKRTALYAKTGTFNKFEQSGFEVKTNMTAVGVRHLF